MQKCPVNRNGSPGIFVVSEAVSGGAARCTVMVRTGESTPDVDGKYTQNQENFNSYGNNLYLY